MMSINNIRRYGSVFVATLGAGLLFMSNTAVHADSAVTNVVTKSVEKLLFTIIALMGRLMMKSSLVVGP